MDFLLSLLLAHWLEYCADGGVWRLNYLTLHCQVVLILETVINTLNSALVVRVDSPPIKFSIEPLYRKQVDSIIRNRITTHIPAAVIIREYRPSTTVSEQNSMEIPRKILAHRQLDNTVSAVVRAVICLIVVLDGHVLTLSSTIRRVTTLMLCIDMITEFRNGFRKSKGGDRTRIDTQTGFYYASAIWIAVFDNDNSLWNFKIIQILVVLGDMCQQKKTGTTHGASIMVLFLFANHHIPFQLQDDSPGDSSLSDLHRRDVFLELCKSNTTQEATGEKRAGEGWTRSEITSLMSTIVTPLVGPAVGAFWGSIFAFASPKILQKICTALKDWQMSRPVTSGARWAMDSARPIIPPSPSQMEAGTRIIAMQNVHPSIHVLPPPATIRASRSRTFFGRW
ncbi:hypothetical protein CSPX01_08930 [Colletotrichum filicis]|nr:hypothetical protein CSPX01_08930 [Colletotrichum filicis]